MHKAPERCKSASTCDYVNNNNNNDHNSCVSAEGGSPSWQGLCPCLQANAEASFARRGQCGLGPAAKPKAHCRPPSTTSGLVLDHETIHLCSISTSTLSLRVHTMLGTLRKAPSLQQVSHGRLDLLPKGSMKLYSTYLGLWRGCRIITLGSVCIPYSDLGP